MSSWIENGSNSYLTEGAALQRGAARNRLVMIVVIALALRLACIPFVYQAHLDTWHEHWRFGFEEGRVAASLASGQGFSSPFLHQSGPTAVVPPLYPTLLAGIFKLFGIYSLPSAIVALSLNSLFSALTCIPVFFLARRSFGLRVAMWAAGTWALFPYAIFLSADRIWETALTTLLLTCLLLFTLYLAEQGGVRAWTAYGALWGLTALSNPSVLAVLPFLGLWACYRRRSLSMSWLLPAAAAALVFACVLLPWEVRDYTVFHRLMPIRDNFWLEFRLGNTGDMTAIDPDWAHPRTPEQFAQFRRLGELGYMKQERTLALNFVTHSPGKFVWVTLKRVVFTWTGFWSLDPAYTADEPFEFANVAFSSIWTALMLAGLALAWRPYPVSDLLPYPALILVFPAVYYLTHPGCEFRHPVDPVVVIFSASALVHWFARQTSQEPLGESLTAAAD